MAIALASSGAQATPAQSCVVSLTISANDYLVAGYASDVNATSMSSYGAPLAQDVTNTSNNDGQTFFAASGKATAGASSITSQSSGTGQDAIAGLVAAFSGVDTTTPQDATPVSASSTPAVTSTGGLAITTVTDGAMLALVTGIDNGTTDPTFTINDGGAGLTWNTITAYESGGFRKLTLAYAIKPTAGAITVTGNFGLSAGFGAVLYALRPAAGGGGGGGDAAATLLATITRRIGA